ncbi:MAG: response regulator [Phycisphaerales bacterium]|nr:response regulator [Phycisphaerales bacterium]
MDDEANILKSYQRNLRRNFAIDVALSGDEGLNIVRAQGPYSVIITDMRMPGMDGIEFLRAVRSHHPDTVRIMLTGTGDQATAVQAVNEGNVFRFLNKPCATDDLVGAITAGIDQYHLITAEKVLLHKTLCGSIGMLNEVLALASPKAFGHATRVRNLVRKLCGELKVERVWECEIAAMLSQIGCVTVPPDTLDRAYGAAPLTATDAELLDAMPQVGAGLVARIPRLDRVSRIIAYQQKNFDGSGVPHDDVRGEQIPLGARILKVALDYDTAKWRRDDCDALTRIDHRARHYDPKVVRALKAVVLVDAKLERCEIALDDLRPGMMLAADVKTSDNMTVVASGQEVTDSLYQRIRNFARHRTIIEPLIVLMSASASTEHGATGVPPVSA